jgi:hypothetical protein
VGLLLLECVVVLGSLHWLSVLLLLLLQRIRVGILWGNVGRWLVRLGSEGVVFLQVLGQMLLVGLEQK